MSNIIPFKRPKPSEKFRGRSLCREGFHKWKADPNTKFDVKAGKLLTRYTCQRCGLVMTRAD